MANTITDKPKGMGFEQQLHLAAMLDFQYDAHQFGAYLLDTSQPGQPASSPPQVVFGFHCPGIHAHLEDAALERAFDQLEQGLKSMPDQETLTLRLVSASSYRERRQQLQGLMAAAPSPELRFLVAGELQRGEQLALQGLREPKTLIFYATYTPQVEQGAQDWWGKCTRFFANQWKQLSGGEEDSVVEQVLGQAYGNGFLRWFNFLSEQLGLAVMPMSVSQLWADAFYRLNPESVECPPIPQTIRITEQEMVEEITSDWDGPSLLCLSELPICDRRWVYVKGQYTGVLVWHEKPAGWTDKRSQLQYLWTAIARDLARDTEIICQLMAGNPFLVSDSIKRVAKQAHATARSASGKGSLDVEARFAAERAVEAQESLLSGNVPMMVALTFLVHRPSLEQLEQACRYLMQSFSRPAILLRETEIPQRLWLDSLAIVKRRMLVSVPTDRRLTFASDEVPGMAPWITTQSRDHQGLELISECGTPQFIDLFSQHKNLAVFGTTRSGKSVLVSGILTQALAAGMPVVAMDYPKGDGTSTFTDFTGFNHGAYFDIGKEASNLFELPDLRGLSPTLRRERMNDYRDFLLQAVVAMVITAAADPFLEKTVRSILGLALTRFFEDAEIQDRYRAAQDQGLGSRAWQRMPTLQDFRALIDPELLRLEVSVAIEQALGLIRLQLDSWLHSRVGQAISQPSTVQLDNQLLVFALRNLGSDEEAAILSLSAYSCALRRTLAYPKSIFFIDESPILFEFPSIAALVGRLCANGAKSGVRVILSAQDPNTIGASCAGAKIFQNMPTRLIGRLLKSAPQGFEQYMGYPQAVLQPNTSEGFYPKRSGIYSRWFLDDGGRTAICRFYPGFRLLGTVANNPDEQRARNAYLEAYSDPFEAVDRFGAALAVSIQAGEPIRLPQGQGSGVEPVVVTV